MNRVAKLETIKELDADEEAFPAFVRIVVSLIGKVNKGFAVYHVISQNQMRSRMEFHTDGGCKTDVGTGSAARCEGAFRSVNRCRRGLCQATGPASRSKSATGADGLVACQAKALRGADGQQRSAAGTEVVACHLPVVVSPGRLLASSTTFHIREQLKALGSDGLATADAQANFRPIVVVVPPTSLGPPRVRQWAEVELGRSAIRAVQLRKQRTKQFDSQLRRGFLGTPQLTGGP